MVFEILQPITKPSSACSGSETLQCNIFLASQDALEVMRVTEWVSEWTFSLTLLIWPWWVRILSHWLYWYDPGEWGYLSRTSMMWKLSSDKSEKECAWHLWLSCCSPNNSDIVGTLPVPHSNSGSDGMISTSMNNRVQPRLVSVPHHISTWFQSDGFYSVLCGASCFPSFLFQSAWSQKALLAADVNCLQRPDCTLSQLIFKLTGWWPSL